MKTYTKYLVAEAHIVYLIRCGDTDYYKIGVTAEIEERMKDLQTSNPFELKLIGQYPLGRKNAYSAESCLCSFFEEHRIRGEWFDFEGKDTGWIEENFYRIAADIGWYALK